MALDFREFSPVIVGQIGGGHGWKETKGKKTYVRLTGKEIKKRNDKIRDLVSRGWSTFKIYNHIKDLGIISNAKGDVQSIRSIGVCVCHIREEMGIQIRQRFRVSMFQKLKGKGFNRRRVMQIMKISEFSYQAALQNYWYEKTKLPDHNKKVCITAKLQKKAYKMVMLGYTKDKIREHLQLTNEQYKYLQSSYYKLNRKGKKLCGIVY